MAYVEVGAKAIAYAIQADIIKMGWPAKLEMLGEPREGVGLPDPPYYDSYRISTMLDRRGLTRVIRRGGYDAYVSTIV